MINAGKFMYYIALSMIVCGLTIGLQWLQMVNGVLNLNIHFWWVLWVLS
jgi:hypothetical protein